MKTSLYIHIPFCERKCSYCNFCSCVADEDMKACYIDFLIDEGREKLKLIKCDDDKSQNANGKMALHTVYIGGGTPSCLAHGELTRLICGLNIDTQSLKEFTVECNPNTITKAKLDELNALGVTRISIGVQSLDNECLSIINRLHTSQEAIRVVRLAVKFGFKVSVDFMVGLPKQNIDGIASEIKTLIDCGIEHLSCYSLILEEGTPLYKRVERGEITIPDSDIAVDMYDAVATVAELHGLARYETSNFGTPCLHNMAYWTMRNYIGIGVSAHSFYQNMRVNNTDNLEEYLNGINLTHSVNLSIAEQAGEYMMLGLRLAIGADMVMFRSKYGEVLTLKVYEIASQLARYMLINDTNIAIKPEYCYVANNIICDFIELE